MPDVASQLVNRPGARRQAWEISCEATSLFAVEKPYMSVPALAFVNLGERQNSALLQVLVRFLLNQCIDIIFTCWVIVTKPNTQDTL